MPSPYAPPATVFEARVESTTESPLPPRSGYLLANFLLGLAGLAQFVIASFGVLGVFSYLTASPSNPEGYEAIICAVVLFPFSIVVMLISALLYRAKRTQIYLPIRWWLAIASSLPTLMLTISIALPFFFGGIHW